MLLRKESVMHITIGRVHGAQQHAGGRRAALSRGLCTIGLLTIFALGVFVAPLAAEAQQAKKVPRIAYLSNRSPGSETLTEAFRQGLRQLGYVDGKDVSIEYRSAEGKADRLPELAAELVRLKVDIIVAQGIQAALAAKNATNTIPIVMAGLGRDPVEAGLVTNLTRPGGNITGFTNLGAEMSGKGWSFSRKPFPELLMSPFSTIPPIRAIYTRRRRFRPRRLRWG
jgi:hypothetical protein